MSEFAELPVEIHHNIARHITYSKSLLTLANLMLVSRRLNLVYSEVYKEYLLVALSTIQVRAYDKNGPVIPLGLHAPLKFAPKGQSFIYWIRRLSWLPPQIIRNNFSLMRSTALSLDCVYSGHWHQSSISDHTKDVPECTYMNWSNRLRVLADEQWWICLDVLQVVAGPKSGYFVSKAQAFQDKDSWPFYRGLLRSFERPLLGLFSRVAALEEQTRSKAVLMAPGELELFGMVMELLIDRLGFNPWEIESSIQDEPQVGSSLRFSGGLQQMAEGVQRLPEYFANSSLQFLYEMVAKPLTKTVVREAARSAICVACPEGTETMLVTFAVKRLLFRYVAEGKMRVTPCEMEEDAPISRFMSVIETLVENFGGWHELLSRGISDSGQFWFGGHLIKRPPNQTNDVLVAWRNGEIWPIILIARALTTLTDREDEFEYLKSLPENGRTRQW
ncbi:hypothetical protein BJ508DRAFT_149999 [Ascobolus immersus RN42]|uniref:F-box domain-containing protein n=1 Tax=Ascobolus immersus RN42 TaxID=1160509 RepID=A0A3N4I4I3_ASCIM|nr:hypothetical protein BJ508DRAFT_149999 [Ascobolus immersus RN42]